MCHTLQAAKIVARNTWSCHLIRFRFMLPSVVGDTLPDAVSAAQHVSILSTTVEAMG
jgi:hypothetical protein